MKASDMNDMRVVSVSFVVPADETERTLSQMVDQNPLAQEVPMVLQSKVRPLTRRETSEFKRHLRVQGRDA